MNNKISYPSCIKIPSTASKQSTNIMTPLKFEVKEALAFNNELILLANQIFGTGKWSHTVTNQSLDFVEPFMGKYVCGCVTFVKIQLQNGTFHEDIGYSHVEGATKGSAVYCARIGSLTDAFKKVLICFDDTIEKEIQILMKRVQSTNACNIQTEDLPPAMNNVESEILEPCAQFASSMCQTLGKSKSPNNPKGHTEIEEGSKSKHPNDQRGQAASTSNVFKTKSPHEQRQANECVNSPKPQAKNWKDQNVQESRQCNGTSHQKERNDVQLEKDQGKVLSEEELLRMERKRKQMEKQAEYKRLMKEREQQKPNENKRPNPKY